MPVPSDNAFLRKLQSFRFIDQRTPTDIFTIFLRYYRYAARLILFIAIFEFVICSGIKNDRNTTSKRPEFKHEQRTDVIGEHYETA